MVTPDLPQPPLDTAQPSPDYAVAPPPTRGLAALDERGPSGPAATLADVSLHVDGGLVLLDSVDLTLQPGDVVGVIGQSGSGKSALFDVLRLARPPTTGRYRLFDQDAARLNGRERAGLKRRLGVVHQTPKLMEHLSVFDNVALPLRLSGQPESAYVENVTDLIAYLGLQGAGPMPVVSLSSAERRRLAIARAVVSRPGVLFADHPFEGLGSQAQDRVIALIQQLARAGAAVFFTSPDQADAERLGARRMRLRGGRLEGEA